MNFCEFSKKYQPQTWWWHFGNEKTLASQQSMHPCSCGWQWRECFRKKKQRSLTNI